MHILYTYLNTACCVLQWSAGLKFIFHFDIFKQLKKRTLWRSSKQKLHSQRSAAAVRQSGTHFNETRGRHEKKISAATLHCSFKDTAERNGNEPRGTPSNMANIIFFFLGLTGLANKDTGPLSLKAQISLHWWKMTACECKMCSHLPCFGDLCWFPPHSTGKSLIRWENRLLTGKYWITCLGNISQVISWMEWGF